MILLVGCALLALVIALARRGDLTRLAHISFRAGWLALAALLLQILVFSSPWSNSVLSRWTPLAYVASMVLLVIAAGLNWRLPGFALITAGLLSNALAIALNGGRMPVSEAALRIAGLENMALGAGIGWANSFVADSATRLPYLGDILALPSWFPIKSVFSVGDVLIAAGAAWFILAVVTPKRTA